MYSTLILAGASLLSLAAPATNPTPPSEPDLRVALSGNYMPLHGREGGVVVGLEVELAEAVGAALKRRVIFVDTRKNFGLGSVEAVAGGKVDLAINSITPTPERAQQVDFTQPYITLKVLLAGYPSQIFSEARAVTDRIAVPAGALAERVRERAPQAVIILRPSLAAAIGAVLAHDADLVAYEDVGLRVGLAETTIPILGGALDLGEVCIAMAVPKGQARRYDEILAGLSGKVAELARQWRVGDAYLSPSERDLIASLPHGWLREVTTVSGKWVHLSYRDDQGRCFSVSSEGGVPSMAICLKNDTAVVPIRRATRGEQGLIELWGPGHHLSLQPKEDDRWSCTGCNAHNEKAPVILVPERAIGGKYPQRTVGGPAVASP